LLLLFAAAEGSAQHYVARTFAGDYSPFDGGPALSAVFESPQDIVIDSKGNVFIADPVAAKIRRIDRNGVISTYANVATGSLAVGRSDEVYAVSAGSIVRVNPDGTLTRIAGTGRPGSTGNGGRALDADMEPTQIAAGPDGSIYFLESNLHTLRKVTPDGVVSLVAGAPRQAGGGGDNGPADAARLNNPADLAVDGSGNVFVADNSGTAIRRITPDSRISTMAGGGCCGVEFGVRALGASIGEVRGLTTFGAGTLYWTTGNHHVATLAGDNITRLVAGVGEAGYGGDGGPGRTAMMDSPLGLAVDPSGALWIAEAGNQRIRMITAEGVVRTVAGRGHYSGDGGPATAALLNVPSNLARDASGNLYISDSENHVVRRVAPGGVITTVAGTGQAGYNGDGRPANTAMLHSPGALLVDPAGNLLLVDRLNYRVRRIRQDGTIETVAGSGIFGNRGDNGSARGAEFGYLSGLALARDGRLFVSDSEFHRIRVIGTDGSIKAFAGTGTAGFFGDNGDAGAARLNRPDAIFVDAQDNLFVADASNQRIRRISSDGVITTVLGGGPLSPTLEGTPAASVGIPNPKALWIDGAGNLWFTGSDSVYRMNADRIVFLAAGGGKRDADLKLKEDSPATDVWLGFPDDLVVDPDGMVYVAAGGLHRVVRLIANHPARLEIVGGDRQTGPAGRQLPEPLRVRVSGAAGVPIAGVAVRFAVASGSAALVLTVVRTGVDGVAASPIQFGDSPGAVTVTAAAPGLPQVTFTLTATQGSGGSPVTGSSPFISGVAGAGASNPPVTAVSENAIVSVYGDRFAAEGLFREATLFDLDGVRLTERLAGVCVDFDGRRAPVLLVTPRQLNVIVPALPAGESIQVRTITNCGNAAAESASAPVTVAVHAATPEWFYTTRFEDGRSGIAAVHSVTGQLIGPGGSLSGSTFLPAKPLDLITLFGTGFGATNPPSPPGMILQDPAPVTAPLVVTLGPVTLDPADVLYVGVSPFLAGVYQANLRVPAGLPDGDHEVRIRIGSEVSPAGFLTVRGEN
jgi:uncharacterized protein (TIGR03437 family)